MMEGPRELYRIDVGRQARVTYDDKKEWVFPNAERRGGELAEASQMRDRGDFMCFGQTIIFLWGLGWSGHHVDRSVAQICEYVAHVINNSGASIGHRERLRFDR